MGRSERERERLGLDGSGLNPLGGERLAATAAAMGVGIVDLEAATGQGIAEVDDRSAHVICGERIHNHTHAMELGAQVIRPTLVEDHPVLHAAAATGFHEDPQTLACVLCITGQHSRDLLSRALGDSDNSILGNDGFHCLRLKVPVGTVKPSKGAFKTELESMQQTFPVPALLISSPQSEGKAGVYKTGRGSKAGPFG